MSIRKSKFLKGASLTMAIILLSEIILPTAALAITGGDSQPDYGGYQPVDATDNVSLVTGGFNYTIPIASVPEYPMAISYRSGVKPGMEAGSFGYGVHGFSGSINRNMIGLPDDLNGAKKVYQYRNETHWSASGGATLGVGASVGPVGLNVSTTMNAGYDNYTGVFGSISFGISAGSGASVDIKGIPVSLSAGVGLGLVGDSRYGADIGSSFGTSVGIGELVSTGVRGSGGFGESFTAETYISSIADFGISDFSLISSNSSATSLTPLQSVVATSKGFGVSLSVPVPVTPPLSLSINGAYSRFEVEGDPISKRAYGFQYLSNYDRAQADHIADFTIEGENSYPKDVEEGKPDQRTNPSYLQRDYFVANAMGFAGTMQFHQEEYGVVSRNKMRSQYRDVGLVNIQTIRQEVYPWHNSEAQRINREVDILALLKKGDPESKDFDNVLFTPHELANLNEDKYRFGKAKLKMRGELVGEFNLSQELGEPDPITLSLKKVTGSGLPASAFLMGHEKDMELKVPALSPIVKREQNAGEIESGTNITYYTISDILNKYSDELGTSRTDKEEFEFEQSFYNHYKYSATVSKGTHVHLSDENVDNLNILDKLNGLASEEEYYNSLIGWIEVMNAEGLKYIFNLPVFAKETESLQLIGKGKIPPVKRGDDYNSFDNKERNKVRIKDEFAYPCAWLLTAIVGEDYIDFDDIPGPSDGDLGYWVKFKYTQTSENYRWRFPFTGLNHNMNAIEKADDDVYSMSTGEKEIYVLAEIESSEYYSKYNYQKRYDGLDAAQYANGEAENTLQTNGVKDNLTPDLIGDNFQFAVTSVDLYKKHPQAYHSFERNESNLKGQIVKSTLFEYDYSLSPEVLNNLTNYSGYRGIRKTDVDYIYNADDSDLGTGKLTLRRVKHIAYDENENPTSLPSYVFNYYGGDAPGTDDWDKYNPSYDAKQVDRWGNYSQQSKSKGYFREGGSDSLYHYTNYCEYDPAIAKDNAKAYHLKNILLPSGGEVEVDYQAQSYGYVEDQQPYNMRRIKDGYFVEYQNGDSKNVKLSIDVSDICRDELNNGIDAEHLKGLNTFLKINVDTLEGQIAFHQRSISPFNNELFIAQSKGVVKSIDSPIEQGGRYYQTIELAYPYDKDNKVQYKEAPFLFELRKFMLGESVWMRSVKESLSGDCKKIDKIVEAYEKMEKDDPLDAVRKIATSFASLVRPDANFETNLEECVGGVGDSYYEHLSFIRVPIYKAKYTGTRVETLKYSDNFNYGTAYADPENTVSHSNNYGTQYIFNDYDEELQRERSMGVATIEPGGGYSSVIDINDLRGAGVMPSPSILSSKTILKNVYNDENLSDQIVSRKKGKTVYEFYTPKDEGLQATNWFKEEKSKLAPASHQGHYYTFGIFSFFMIKFKIFRKEVQIKVPIWLPINLKWDRGDQYRNQSFAYVDNTDMYGRLKGVSQYGELDNEVAEASQEYQYFAPDDNVTVFKNSFDSPVNMRPGKIDQLWSEAYYTKKTDLNLLPWALTMFARTNRNFFYNTVGYSYVPPMVQKVTTYADGIKVETENTGFDYYTGQPIEVRSEDSYKNTKIKRVVPAYWEYPEMGPVYDDENNLNKLTAKTGAYMYLESVDINNLIGASVTRWSKSSWAMADYLAPKLAYIDDGRYIYVYETVTGSDMKDEYNAAARNVDKHVKRNAFIYRPTQSYVYEAELNTNGTYKDFHSFAYNYAPANNWKLVNTNQLYNEKGALLQSMDILGKYASQQLGYGNTLPIGIAANASYGASVFEGAENSYTNERMDILLENNRVIIGDAEIIKADCEDQYQEFEIDLDDYLSDPVVAANLTLLSVEKPDTYSPNQPFAKVEADFSTGHKRTLYISIDENDNYRIYTNFGEEFTGFVTLPNYSNPGDKSILFDYDDHNSFILDISYPSNGFILENVVENVDGLYDCGNNKAISYLVPLNDCYGAHTGTYAFALQPGGSGTEFTLSSDKVVRNELLRKYKSFVWVKNNSPLNTSLVVEKRTVNGLISKESVSLAEATQGAGGWSLLRLDFDLSSLNYNSNVNISDYAIVYVENSSSDGVAIYDDLRVLPYHAEMSNYVYDHLFNRVSSTLDADNYASFSIYDERGRVIENKVEIDGQGVKTISKTLYNDQKKD